MIKSKCEWCEKEITRRGDKPGRFCSLKCKAEWQRTQKPVTEEWLRQKYLIEQLSTYDIAKLVQRNPKQVYQWLVGYGIPTRPRGENLSATDDCYMRRDGVTNPFQGKHHSEETRARLSEAAQVEKPWLRGAANGMYGRRGNRNPNFVDGSSPERQRLYASAEWKAVLRTVYERDGYRCGRCGVKKSSPRSLHAHHVKPWAGNPESRFDLSNIVTLCASCHRWVHSRANIDREFL